MPRITAGESRAPATMEAESQGPQVVEDALCKGDRAVQVPGGAVAAHPAHRTCILK